MKLHRFIGSYDIGAETIEINNPEIVKQIKGVLRLEVGEALVLSDGRGKLAEYEIKEITKDQIDCSFLRTLPVSDPDKKVSLYLAILKKENFELAVQKAVECGVTNIIPVLTERTVKTGLNTTRLEKIIREASEQSERAIVPTLQKILPFENALAHGYASEEKVLFDANSSAYSPKDNAKSASIFVGPEGGFTEKEIAMARSAGYIISSLGSLILRGETAAVIATYRAVHGI